MSEQGATESIVTVGARLLRLARIARGPASRGKPLKNQESGRNLDLDFVALDLDFVAADLAFVAPALDFGAYGSILPQVLERATVDAVADQDLPLA
jgi:hypothetical protein